MSCKLTKENIIEIFNKFLLLKDFTFKQESINQFWMQLIANVQFFIENQEAIFQEYDDEFRYRDYYDYNQDAEYTISLLDTLGFNIFCLADELDAISAVFLDKSFSKQEKESLLDDFIISKVNTFSSHAKELFEEKLQNTKKDILLPFEVEPQFKIFFSGLFMDDIKVLPKDVIIKVINKLSNPLSKSLIIQHSETIDNIKEKYNVPIARVPVACDYRIAYIRYKKSTIILGVNLKTGKYRDYTRYGVCANKIKEIYKDADDFLDGITMKKNNEVYEYLRNIYKRNLIKKDENSVHENTIDE